MPEIETTNSSTIAEEQDTIEEDVKQDQETSSVIIEPQSVEAVELTVNKTLDVETNVVTASSEADEINLLLPSVEEPTVVSRTQENVLSSDQAHVTSEEVHVTSEEVHVTSEEAHVTSEEAHVTSGEDHVTSGEAHVTSEEAHVTSGEDHVISVQDVQQNETTVEIEGLTVEMEKQQEDMEGPLQEEAVATLEVSESIEVVQKPVVSTVTELPTMPAYPRLDSLIEGE